MPFLSIVTRCYKRPMMLMKNRQSVEGQTDPDFVQLFIVDDIGRGVGWANRALRNANPTGDYVMVLDDDDVFADPNAITELKIAAESRPDLVIFKCNHGPLGQLPDNLIWKRRPLKGHIGSCSFISRLDVWQDNIRRFGVDEGGDYAYLHAVWMHQPRVVWLDRLLTAVQRISKGAVE